MAGTTMNGGADPRGPTPVRLHFDRFVLDCERGCLLLDGKEIPLRPKTFAVLRHLAENPGKLVSKEVLFASVWPGLVVTDDVLVQSIGELRRALGDDGARVIRTVPRRGYRLEAAVAGDAPRRRLQARWSVAAVALLFLGAVLLWKALQSPPAPTRVTPWPAPAIAVLAFVDHSDEPGHEYFADGLTQDVITALGRFSSLTVMSWNAVLPYKGKVAPPERVGSALGAAYLVEGSVRRIGERMHVNARLVDARHGQVLWSERLDEPLSEVFKVQDRIASRIVAALAVNVTQIEQRRVLDKPTASLEAYDYVLRARPALQRPTRNALAEARVLLRRAIALDPRYAAAYSTLAESYYVAASMGWAESPAETLARAEELALKAVDLDGIDVRARVLLGRIHILHQRFNEAESEIERAIAANPNDAQGLAGRGNVLMWLGRTEDAMRAFEAAQRIDARLNTLDRFALGMTYYMMRRYDDAIEQAQLNVRDHPEAHFSYVLLAAGYAQSGRAEDARRAAASALGSNPTFDAAEFGTKFLNAGDLEHLRQGMRKAGLWNPGKSAG